MVINREKEEKQPLLLITIDPGPWGAGIRFNGICQALAAEFEVTTFFFKAKRYSQKTSPNTLLSRFGRTPDWARHATSDAQAAFEQHLQEKIQTIQPVLLVFSGTAILPFLPQQTDILTILDAYDINWVRLQRKLTANRSLTLRHRLRVTLEVTLAKRYEGKKHALADEIWVCSDIDGRSIKDNGYTGKVQTVPNFFPQNPHSICITSKQSTSTILFVGTMGYHANRDGVSWFLRHCWPQIKQLQPEARFWVVGNWPDWAQPGAEYQQAGVQTFGYIEDLASIWQTADVFLCPLQVGSGTRIKILEAWSNRLPVLATSIGIEGLLYEPGVNALVEDEPAKLVQATHALLQDATLRQSIGKAGYETWHSHYTLEKVSQLVLYHCRELIK